MKTSLKKIILIILFIPFLPTMIPAQPSTLWEFTCGGEQPDEGRYVIQNTGGTFIVTGFTFSYSAGSADVYLIEVGVNGDTVWTETFGGSYYDRGNVVQQTMDGGYIIAGETNSYGAGEADLWLIKTDALGFELWSNTFGGEADDIGYDLQQTSDGGFIIVGTTYSNEMTSPDILLVKADMYGDEEWIRIIGGDEDEEGYGIRQTPDDGFIIAAYSSSNSPYGAYLYKTDSRGLLEWTEALGGGNNANVYGMDLTTEGGYIVVGSTSDYGAGAQDIFLVKTNSIGGTIWEETYGGIFNDYGHDVHQTFDGGFIITGSSIPNEGSNDEDLYVLKVNSDGVMQWDLRFGTGEGYHSFGYGIQQTMDGGYIATGKTDPVSSLQYEVFMIRLDEDLNVLNNPPDLPAKFCLHEPHPNPFNQRVALDFALPAAAHIELTVYDLAGREVAQLVDGYINAGSHEIIFDAKDFASGVYFVKMESGEFRQVKKLVLMK